MLIEDNKAFARLMKLDLEERAYEVQIGFSGFEALEIFNEFKPDISFVDLIMPYMNGIETLQAIKKINPLSRVVILCPVLGTDDVLFRLYIMSLKEKGVDGLMLKPVHVSQVVRTIKDVLSKPAYNYLQGAVKQKAMAL